MLKGCLRFMDRFLSFLKLWSDSFYDQQKRDQLFVEFEAFDANDVFMFEQTISLLYRMYSNLKTTKEILSDIWSVL